jgi:hypothetical protein
MCTAITADAAVDILTMLFSKLGIQQFFGVSLESPNSLTGFLT